MIRNILLIAFLMLFMTSCSNIKILEPNNSSIYNNRSVSKFNLCQYEEVIKDYKKSLELKNNSIV
ncbi:unnamed protein product [Brachyspira suanatina]|uniref:Uncharacterized protein n=1 Tax=Brachyspira suanatina TaxID=381802 RepID=A0A0G4K9R1_9SPIR|nr:hypothetical protein [Brachyspira suanatina]CRF35117.1 unnamed protein product [Brachyspira suanatina]